MFLRRKVVYLQSEETIIHINNELMKKLFTLAVLMVIAVSAHAMSYTDAQREALYLTDKMAYELDLSPEQFEAVYEINFDYFYSVSHRRDIYGNYWSRRDSDLRFVLSPWQYELYAAATYFYHPVYWYRGAFTFTIYSRYTNRNHFFRPRPARYSSYRGGYNRGASRYRGRTFNAPATRPSTHQSFDHGRTHTQGNHPGTNRPRTQGNNPGTNRPRTQGNNPGSSRPRTQGNNPGSSRPRTSSSSSSNRPRTSGSTSGSSRPRTSGSSSSSRSPHASGHR